MQIASLFVVQMASYLLMISNQERILIHPLAKAAVFICLANLILHSMALEVKEILHEQVIHLFRQLGTMATQIRLQLIKEKPQEPE